MSFLRRYKNASKVFFHGFEEVLMGPRFPVEDRRGRLIWRASADKIVMEGVFGALESDRVHPRLPDRRRKKHPGRRRRIRKTPHPFPDVAQRCRSLRFL